MEARIDEIGDSTYRLSIHVPELAGPAGFTFNQFLVLGEEPLLFHCGLRKMFSLVSGAVARIIPLERLRWITFGHFEADECGSMDEWLAAAPRAQIAHGVVGCGVSIRDMAARPPRVLADGEVIDIGGKRIRYIDTPHVPHGWDAGVIFEESTATLFCGDLFTQLGNSPALTETDIVEPAMAAEDSSTSPASARPPHRPFVDWPIWRRAPWRSCTARLSPAMQPRRSAAWPTTTNAACGRRSPTNLTRSRPVVASQ